MLPANSPEGFKLLHQMVRAEDRGIVVALALIATNREDDEMGIIPDNLDNAYDDTEVGGGTGGLLPAGHYNGVVVSAEVRESRKPWVDAEMSIKLQVVDSDGHDGKFTFCDFELAPLTNKQGEPSAGKLKFVKWQLESLGYDGKLSEIEFNVGNLIGAKVSFEQKVEDYLDASGNPTSVNGRSPRINENTGKPYVDREVVLRDCLVPGAGAAVSSAAPLETGHTAIY